MFALTPAWLIKSWYAARALLLYWPFLNNWILLLLQLSSCPFSNSFSFLRNLTWSYKSSNFGNNKGSDSFFGFISFEILVLAFFQSPIICNTFLQPCCLFLSASSYLSSVFSDFRQFLRTSFLFSFLFMFLVFSVF